MSQPASKRITVCDKKDYTIQLEYNELFAIVHLEKCNKLSKEVFKSIQDFLDGLEDFVVTAGYDGLYTASLEPKPEKLAHMLGFNYIGEQGSIKVFKYARSSSNRSG